MKVLVTGINGLVGKDIAGIFKNNGYSVIGVGRSDKCEVNVEYHQTDLMDFSKTGKLIADINPNIIVHCAAYTRLDDCENNKDYAKKMNVEVTDFLASKCDKFVYISSDAVFSGNNDKSYTEESIADPINYYGKTKYDGEECAKKNSKALIIRSSLYGYRPDNESAIAEWGLRSLLRDESITGFSDVSFNPLYSKQFAEAILFLVEGDYAGVYHLGCDENISKYEFFRKIAMLVDKSPDLVKPGLMSEKEFKAKRTKDTCLNVQKFTDVFRREFSLNEGLRDFIRDVREAKGF